MFVYTTINFILRTNIKHFESLRVKFKRIGLIYIHSVPLDISNELNSFKNPLKQKAIKYYGMEELVREEE